jgi:hypothetical protein
MTENTTETATAELADTDLAATAGAGGWDEKARLRGYVRDFTGQDQAADNELKGR